MVAFSCTFAAPPPFPTAILCIGDSQLKRIELPPNFRSIAVPGATCSILGRRLYSILLHRYTHIVVHVGSNDILTKTGDVTSNTRVISSRITCFLKLIESHANLTTRVYFNAIVPALPGRYVSDETIAYRNNAARHIQQIFSQDNTIIRHHNIWMSRQRPAPGVLSDDGLHLSAKGAQLVAANILAAVTQS